MTFPSQNQKIMFTASIYYSFRNLQKITHKCSNKALPRPYQSALEILPILISSESFYILVDVSMSLKFYQPCSYKSSLNVKPFKTHSKRFYSTFSGLIIALFFVRVYFEYLWLILNKKFIKGDVCQYKEYTFVCIIPPLWVLAMITFGFM